jgi:phage-related protein
MKTVVFEGDTLLRIRSFPEAARQRVGYEIQRVQQDKDPENWESFSMVGPDVREISIQVNGHYRVLYSAKIDNKLRILHAYEKTSQKTRQADIELAKSSLKKLMERLSQHG